MALQPFELAKEVVRFFKDWEDSEDIVRILTKFFEKTFDHMKAELELQNFVKAWDNFNKDDLNRGTFTVITIVPSGTHSTNASTTSDEVILQNTGSGVGTDYDVTLPASPFDGQQVTVKDTSGNANNRAINLLGNGNQIDDSASESITTQYGALTVVYDGSTWHKI